MPDDPESLLDQIEKHYQFFVFLFSMFAICMGFARTLGAQSWQAHEELRRGKLGLPIASLVSSGKEKSFDYSSLFRGGLTAVLTVFWLSLYVPFMLIAVVPTDLRELNLTVLIPAIRALLLYPIGMLFVAPLPFFSFTGSRRYYLPPVSESLSSSSVARSA
jgi:hypothetical protein